MDLLIEELAGTVDGQARALRTQHCCTLVRPAQGSLTGPPNKAP